MSPWCRMDRHGRLPAAIWSQARCARSANETGSVPFARSLDCERVVVARLSTTRLGDHLCQHSEHVANHVESIASAVPAPLNERRTSRLPQRGQTSPMADEITSRSRTVRPIQFSDFRQLPGLRGPSEQRFGGLALVRTSARWLCKWHRHMSARRGSGD